MSIVSLYVIKMRRWCVMTYYSALMVIGTAAMSNFKAKLPLSLAPTDVVYKHMETDHSIGSSSSRTWACHLSVVWKTKEPKPTITTHA